MLIILNKISLMLATLVFLASCATQSDVTLYSVSMSGWKNSYPNVLSKDGVELIVTTSADIIENSQEYWLFLPVRDAIELDSKEVEKSSEIFGVILHFRAKSTGVTINPEIKLIAGGTHKTLKYLSYGSGKNVDRCFRNVTANNEMIDVLPSPDVLSSTCVSPLFHFPEITPPDQFSIIIRMSRDNGLSWKEEILKMNRVSYRKQYI